MLQALSPLCVMVASLYQTQDSGATLLLPQPFLIFSIFSRGRRTCLRKLRARGLCGAYHPPLGLDGRRVCDCYGTGDAAMQVRSAPCVHTGVGTRQLCYLQHYPPVTWQSQLPPLPTMCFAMTLALLPFPHLLPSLLPVLQALKSLQRTMANCTLLDRHLAPPQLLLCL